MSKTTILANGQITPTDALPVELQEPDEFPATILIVWPSGAVSSRSETLQCNCECGRTPHGYEHHKAGRDQGIQALTPFGSASATRLMPHGPGLRATRPSKLRVVMREEGSWKPNVYCLGMPGVRMAWSDQYLTRRVAMATLTNASCVVSRLAWMTELLVLARRPFPPRRVRPRARVDRSRSWSLV
jgi:hypothetical protein